MMPLLSAVHVALLEWLLLDYPAATAKYWWCTAKYQASVLVGFVTWEGVHLCIGYGGLVLVSEIAAKYKRVDGERLTVVVVCFAEWEHSWLLVFRLRCVPGGMELNVGDIVLKSDLVALLAVMFVVMSEMARWGAA